MQSPVNLDTTGGYAAQANEDLNDHLHYKTIDPPGLLVENTGHGIRMLNYGDMGYIGLDGDDYQVDHLTLHCPSEHTMDGVTFDCELQIAHSVQYTSKMMIMSIFYVADGLQSNPLIALMGLPVGAPPTPSSASLPVSYAVNLAASFSGLMSKGFFRYSGSVTEPPCTEGVTWLVLEQSVSMSIQQLQAFKAIAGMPSPANNRPVQIMNGRGMFKSALPGCDMEGHKRRLNSEKDEVAWGYVMPQCWPISYPLCGSGDSQSPINIDTTIVDPPGSLTLGMNHGILQDAVLFNSGEELRVNHYHGNMSYDGLRYDTHQFHFKFPGEHAIDGKVYPAEMAIVHQQQGASDRNNLLVVSVMFDYGDKSAFLDQLKLRTGVELPQYGGAGMSVGSINLDELLLPIMEYGFYNYHGSITTPPCEETVGWIVMAGILEATKAQLDVGKAMFPKQSSRPLQKLKERHIGVNGKPWGYPAPLPVNTWLLESQNEDSGFSSGVDLDLDEAAGASRSALLLGSGFAIAVAFAAY